MNEKAEKQAEELLKEQVKKYKIKSKAVTADAVEVNYEVRLKSEDTSFVQQVCRTEGVTQAILVSYNGDYMG